METNKLINLKFRKYSLLEFWIYYVLYTPAIYAAVLFFLFLLLILVDFVFDSIFKFSLIPFFVSKYAQSLIPNNEFILVIFGVFLLSIFIGLFAKFFKSYRAECVIDESAKTVSVQIDQKPYSDIKFVKTFWYLPFVLFRTLGRGLRFSVYALWLRYETRQGEKGYLLLEDGSFLDIKLNSRYQKIVEMEDYVHVISLFFNLGFLTVPLHAKFLRRKKFLSWFVWIVLGICFVVLIVTKF